MGGAPARAQAPAPGGGRQRPAREDGRRACALRGTGGAGADEPKLAGPALRPDLDMATRGGDAAEAWTSRASTSRRSASTRTGTGRIATSPSRSSNPEREAGRGLRRPPRPVRRLRLGSPAVSRPCRRAARGGRQEVRPARSRHRRQCRRRGDQRPQVQPVLGQGRGAGRGGFHPPAGRRDPGQLGSASRATAT